jgi:hypothetical protein
MDMCWNGQGNTILLFIPRKKITLFDWGKLQKFDLTLPLIPNQEQKHIFSSTFWANFCIGRKPS